MATINIVIFEAEGGSDKGFDGHRKDTLPIVKEINKVEGYHCDILFYRDSWAEQLYEHVKDKYKGYIPRVNPGTIVEGEAGFFAFLRKLSAHGLVGMPHPDVMIKYGAKDALVKLAGTPIVPADTYGYYEVEAFKKQFPLTLSTGERVLKQNRGSTGSGIWRVRLVHPEQAVPGTPLPLDTKLKCTEAVDNHVEERELGEFMEFCEQYIVGENGQLVDMTFLPRIKEGEIRILLVGTTPVFVVHKKPAEGAESFSATLFSGAKYTYDKPDKWPDLMKNFELALPQIRDRLGNLPTPLIWCSDFILDWTEDKKDRFILGEINCSCVGFTSQLDYGIQQLIAKEVTKMVHH
jgi:hypothetical protein